MTTQVHPPLDMVFGLKELAALSISADCDSNIQLTFHAQVLWWEEVSYSQAISSKWVPYVTWYEFLGHC